MTLTTPFVGHVGENTCRRCGAVREGIVVEKDWGTLTRCSCTAYDWVPEPVRIREDGTLYPTEQGEEG